MEISKIELPGDASEVEKKEPCVIISQEDQWDEYYVQSVAVPLSYLPTLIQKLKEISDANFCNL